MQVAALQLVAQADVSDNLRNAEGWVDRAAAGGARLIVLPEGFAFLGAERDKVRCAESLTGDGPIVSALTSWAQHHGVYVLAGGLPEISGADSPPFNTSLLVAPNGALLAAYRKMHLFDVDLADGTRLFESRATTAGDLPVVASVDEFKVGLSICYDLRFPELFAWQRAQGAHILTVPSAFTKTTGLAHWHVLLRARAIETQCWVVAAAQQGDHPLGRQTFGHAMIVDPWGRVVAEVAEPGPGMAAFDCDLASLDDVRARMPVQSHRHAFFARPK